jgi:peptidoglycan/xylan/chitin deacetylase (PgdA/CDA1 family)
MRYFLLTNDVEYTLIHENAELQAVAENISNIGIKRVLDLLSKHNIKSTFYFTGNFAAAQRATVKRVKRNGHEIGCHGFSHSRNKSFDLLDYQEQLNEISMAKSIIEKTAGPIVSFRSPELRVNEFTVHALEENGFLTDSSISSQRFDGPLSLGFRYKKKWLTAPRLPYFLSHDSPFKPGNSSVLEIPISAAISPYIGTSMRIAPKIIAYLEKFLFWESIRTGKPIVFIYHPHECMNPDEILQNVRGNYRRASGNIFSELIRPYLKCKNLDKISIDLLEDIIMRAMKKGFNFITAAEYYSIFIEQETRN